MMGRELSLNLRAIEQLAKDLGAAAVGFARIAPVEDIAREQYRAWLSGGYHAKMEYMDQNVELRDDPASLLPEARSIIVMAFSYFTSQRPVSGISRYALGSDYHTALRKQLRPLMNHLTASNAKARICIDSAPLRERYWAVKAGLGFIGKNSQLIIPGVGSYCFLASIITALSLPADFQAVEITDGCGECRRCIDACPGRAISPSRSIDSRRCLSYLTIEAQRAGDYEWPADIRRGHRLMGCDTCQDVCPYNIHPAKNLVDRLQPRSEVLTLTEDSLTKMSPEEFDRRFAGSPLRRPGLLHLQSILTRK